MGGYIPIRVGKPSQTPDMAQPSATEPATSPSEPAWEALRSGLLQVASRVRAISLAELGAYLKRTSRLWLTMTGVIFGLIVLITFTQRLIDRARNARERHHELAVASVTPDRLIARCGEAGRDVTKQVFPILMRSLTYSPSGERTVVLTFSRTAEEKSDWVFLSMNDANGSASYDTPDAKIAVLPCLDSTR